MYADQRQGGRSSAWQASGTLVACSAKLCHDVCSAGRLFRTCNARAAIPTDQELLRPKRQNDRGWAVRRRGPTVHQGRRLKCAGGRTKTWAIALVCLATLASSAQAAEQPPNVVLIIGDDQGWTDFGFMGHEVIQTPRLDQLAAEGASFPNGYVPTSLCRASLATLLTGLYAHQHRICCNDPPVGVDRAEMHPFIQEAPALPRLLGEAGYASLQTGKFWEGHYANAGFTAGMTTQGRHGEAGLAIGRETMDPIYDFIREYDERPFFVWYAPMLPHEPHNPPQRLLEKYLAPDRDERLARYFAMCEWFDETCGQLLDFLDETGHREDTLVLFVIDNGWIQETEPARRMRGNFAPKSKLSPYDGGLRTPVLIRWPEHVQPGVYPDLVSTLDIVPTILAAAELPIPEQMPGLSLLDTAAGRGPLQREAVFGEIYLHTCVDLNRTALNLTHRWVRAGDWKLIVPVAGVLLDSSAEASSVAQSGDPELYNLAEDPHEEHNLAATHAEQVDRLQKLLDAWWDARSL